MSAVPGWYPDPAGSRDLRLWDGETWTSHLRPADAPEAFAGQPTAPLAPARILAVAGAAGPGGPGGPGGAEPSSYFGSAVSAAPLREQDWGDRSALQPTAPGSRRRVIALSVFGAVFIAGGAIATLHLAHTGSVYARTSIAMPKTAAGFKRVAQVSTNVSSDLVKSLPFTGMQMGIYGQGGSPAPVAMLMAGRGKTAGANVDSEMSKAQSSFSASANGEEATALSSFEPVAAGPLGGRMSCATFQVDALPAAACLFLDQGAAGALFTYNTSAVDTALMHRLRAAVEKRS
jgi:hypothetical protein